MTDLNTTTFYKAQFGITRKNADTDLLWEVVQGIRTWITKKYNSAGKTLIDEDLRSSWTPFKSGGRILSSDKRVFCESASCSDETTGYVSWACQIVETPASASSEFARRDWTTEIGYQQATTDSATLSYIVKYNDIPGFWGLCDDAPSISLPNLIRWLFQNQWLVCSIGKHQLVPYPIKLVPGDYPSFEKLVLDSERTIPVVYLSPRHSYSDEENAGNPLVNPLDFFNAVAGNALIYYSESLDFSKEMCWYGNQELLCTNGMIRVYAQRNGLTANAGRARNWYFTLQNICELAQKSASHIEDIDELLAIGSQTTLKIFRRVLAQEVNFYDRLFRIEDCRMLCEDQRHSQKLKVIRKRAEVQIGKVKTEYANEADRGQALEAENKDLKETVTALEALLDEEVEEHRLCEEKRRDLTLKLDAAETDNRSLDIQVQSARTLFATNRALETSLSGIRSINTYPESAEEIAHFFETVYGERLVFTERAKESLTTCTTRPDILWRAFYDIATKLYDLFQEPKNLQEVCTAYEQSTEWKCSATEGKETRKSSRLMHIYDDKYENEAISIEPHIGKGNRETQSGFFRIHFAHDASIAPQIIIGHCGEHLENYTTLKIK